MERLQNWRCPVQQHHDCFSYSQRLKPQWSMDFRAWGMGISWIRGKFPVSLKFHFSTHGIPKSMRGCREKSGWWHRNFDPYPLKFSGLIQWCPAFAFWRTLCQKPQTNFSGSFGLGCVTWENCCPLQGHAGIHCQQVFLLYSKNLGLVVVHHRRKKKRKSSCWS